MMMKVIDDDNGDDDNDADDDDDDDGDGDDIYVICPAPHYQLS